MKTSRLLQLAYVEAFRVWATAYRDMTDLPKNDATLQKVRDAYDEMIEIHQMLLDAKRNEE